MPDGPLLASPCKSLGLCESCSQNSSQVLAWDRKSPILIDRAPKIQTAGVHNKYLGVNLSWWQKTHSKLDGIDRFGRTSICVLLGLVKWLFMGVLWSIYDFTHGLAPCITIVMLCLWTTERSRSPFYGPDNGVDCLANHHRIAIAIASICYMPHLISSKHG